MGAAKMASSRFAQEMPPAGGYAGIDWEAKVPRARLPGRRAFILMGTVMGLSWIGFAYERIQKFKVQLETQDARIALDPLYLADQHRLMMKQLRKNRDDEIELMKDRPDWKTGTWRGKPLYHNIPGRFILPPGQEYLAHCSKRHTRRRLDELYYHQIP